MKYEKDFNDILGQENLKTALLVLAVSPFVNSLLVAGEKGSGKSTTIRGLGNIEGENLIEVPQNITEDRMYGSIDLEAFLGSSEKSFEEGLISKSSEGFLYFDEINLFDPSLLSKVLDFVETGMVQIEREGFSLTEEIDLGIIGSMNPEEGEIKSGVVDKFALYVYVEGLKDVEARKAVMKKNILGLDYDGLEEKIDYRKLIENSIKILPYIRVEDHHIAFADSLVRGVNAQGYRPTFYLIETAKALAALDNRESLSNEDLTLAATYVLPHRKNEIDSQPPTPPEEEDKEEEEEKNNEEDKDENKDNNPTPPPPNLDQDSGENDKDKDKEDDLPKPDSEPQLVRGDEIYKIRDYIKNREDRIYRKGSGKRNLSLTEMKKGKVIGSKLGDTDDIAVLDSIKSSIIHGGFDKENKELNISKDDIRIKKRKKRTGASIVFVVDASGSMSAQKRMKETKNAILSLLMDSYQKRDQVAMISFNRNDANILLPFTRSVLLAKRELQDLKTGGKTPLSKALYVASNLVENKMKKDPETIPILILISDGRANVGGIFAEDPIDDAVIISELIKNKKIHSVVIDTESSFIKLGLPKKIANHLGATYYKIEDLKKEAIEKIVHENVEISLSNVEIMED